MLKQREMKKYLTIIMLSFSIAAFAQPTPHATVPNGTYFVPKSTGGSTGWITVEPGALNNRIQSHNGGSYIDWSDLKDELDNLPNRTPDEDVMFNSLSNYLPTATDYNLGGPKRCCVSEGPDCIPYEWCYSYDCENNCQCVNDCPDEDVP